MSRQSIHPFPARMAPELALSALEKLGAGASVLDPMTGSGTVARQATALGQNVRAFDLDPLAVLISKVSTTPIGDELVKGAADKLFRELENLDTDSIVLDWLDGDSDGERFTNFWFGEPQREQLRKVSFVLSAAEEFGIGSDEADVLRIALSRIIVTKKQAASLAQDTSHSRPHKVSEDSEYDVLEGFEKSIRAVRKRLAKIKSIGSAKIEIGDARSMSSVENESVDFVLTSPPYLNAIDYMRGHRMSLIWLGHKYSDLAGTRSNSIGAERKPDSPIDQELFAKMKMSMGKIADLPPRYNGMIERYIQDIYQMIAEVGRVLKDGKTATFVMGNSCLRGIYVKNSEALATAAKMIGLKEINRDTRALPVQHRYLPTKTDSALANRMREEIILTFQK